MLLIVYGVGNLCRLLVPFLKQDIDDATSLFNKSGLWNRNSLSIVRHCRWSPTMSLSSVLSGSRTTQTTSSMDAWKPSRVELEASRSTNFRRDWQSDRGLVCRLIGWLVPALPALSALPACLLAVSLRPSFRSDETDSTHSHAATVQVRQRTLRRTLGQWSHDLLGCAANAPLEAITTAIDCIQGRVSSIACTTAAAAIAASSRNSTTQPIESNQGHDQNQGRQSQQQQQQQQP